MEYRDKFRGLDKFDLSSISFPTDNLTIGQLRKLYPKDFNAFPAAGRHFSFAESTAALVEQERIYATGVYAQAMGLKSVLLSKDEVETAAECIAADYQNFGLASGPEQAEQLIRDIADQVQAQASQHLKGRGR